MKAILFVAAVFTASVASAEEKARLPQGPPGTVTLPLTDYERLMDRAAHPPKRPDPPPVPAVLERAELKLRVVGDSARGAFHLEGEVFRTGAVKVPLVTGATLLDARLVGRPLPLLQEGAVHTAILSGPGSFSIAVEWGAPVTAEPGRASLVVPVPAAGSARATLEVPGEQADVHLTPGLITRRSSSAGKTTIEATLEPGSQARFWWSARENASLPAARETRALSDVKTLASIGEADLRMAVLVDITVVQGDPQRFELRLPEGFEVAGASGSSLETTAERPGVLTLVVRDASRRRHQFLVSLERAAADGSYKTPLPLPWLEGAQRETGEVALEGVGTLELTATEDGTLRRMDVREANPALRALARHPLLAAFRYHRRPMEALRLNLDVKRFPDAPVLAAVAERGVVTTLVTSEGRTLTEVSLTVRNHAQPFLKVALPEGSTLLSADVAGESVKPVQGEGGMRVPLLRTGFRPGGPYVVSFVYLHSGQPFQKRGDAQFGLPRMDLPVSLLEWELFLPDRYKVKDFGGNVLPSALVSAGEDAVVGGVAGGMPAASAPPPVKSVAEEVAVTTDAATEAQSKSAERARRRDEAAQQMPSANVFNLQRRVAGVLPVRMDVPRTGISHRFVRPLVLDEETVVRFRYKRR